MRKAVYNSAIPENILKSVNGSHLARIARPAHFILLALLAAAVSAGAADWSGPEQQMARKIVAITGPGAVALTVENRSSLGRRNGEIVQNGLRNALEQVGIHVVSVDRATAAVAITLSENPTSYVWVAQIRQGETESGAVLVSVPRSGNSAVAHDSMPMSLHKTLVWSQDNPILDVVVLEENAAPTRIAVVDAEKVSIERSQGGKWQEEQALAIMHSKPWPRDLRGRLIPARDHLFDIFLPGMTCRSSSTVPLTLNCRETDDPWPLVPAGIAGNSSAFPNAGDTKYAVVSAMGAFFAPARNFFTGAFTPAVGKFTNVAKFYSSAFVPRERYALWLFAATDGQVHLLDGMNDQPARFDWGNSIASLKTTCGAGWQVLATSSGERTSDFVRAYEFPDRDPIAVSAPIDLGGAVSALWTEARGDSAVVVVKDQDTGSYEAYRLAMACGQ